MIGARDGRRSSRRWTRSIQEERVAKENAAEGKRLLRTPAANEHPIGGRRMGFGALAVAGRLASSRRHSAQRSPRPLLDEPPSYASSPLRRAMKDGAQNTGVERGGAQRSAARRDYLPALALSFGTRLRQNETRVFRTVS